MSTTSPSTTKYYVYINVLMQCESLQQEIDKAFHIVTDSDLEEYRDKVVAIYAVGNPTLSGRFMGSLPALKVIGSNSVGYDHVDVQAAAKLDVRVGYTPFVLDNAAADAAMTLLLGSARRIVEGDKIARDPSTLVYPGNAFLGQEVSGSTIGIIGMGRIGTKIAKRAVGFDMKVIYHNRRQKSAEEEVVCATYVPVLNELLEQSDFVVLVAPSTKDTYRMMGREQFKAMKKSGIFINVARGALVDHDALVEALKDGEIAHAGLDVTDPEPLPRDHPLLSMTNVSFTPHTGTATYATRKKMVEVTIANIKAGIKGEPLLYEVPETFNAK